VESLSSSDKKTGELLAHKLKALEANHDKGIVVEFIRISTPKELIAHLNNLTKDAIANEVFPILQIEAHGSEDKNSLVLTKGIISWRELEPHLRALNIAMKCNLLIVMATCFGAFATAAISLLDRAPFWGIVGPVNITYEDQILSSLTNFYTSIYRGETPKELFKSINSLPVESQLKFLTCEWLFIKAYKYYINNLCSEELIDIRIRRLKEKHLAQGTVDIPEDDVIRDYLTPKGKTQFESWLGKFFMVDLFPENNNKISVKYEKIDL